MERNDLLPTARELKIDRFDRQRFRVEPSKSRPKRVFLNCHYCGYAPPDGDLRGHCCPKCGGSSWERFALSERLVPQHMK